MYSLINKNDDFQFLIDENKVFVYFFDKINLNIIKEPIWTSNRIELTVIETKYNKSKEVVKNLKTIINSKNDFIKTVKVISSSLKPIGYFIETNELGIETEYLNVFLNSEKFKNSKQLNKYKDRNVIELLENETPTINLFIKNLFHNENDEVIVNFINWLNVASLKDENQKIIFCFFSLAPEFYSQGDVMILFKEFLNHIFNDLVYRITNGNLNLKYNSFLMNKKIFLYDLFEFKNLNYKKIKKIIDSDTLKIKFKKKNSINSKNVSSWIIISEEYNLYNKISEDDDRIFLINPYFSNIDGLTHKVIEKYGDFKTFVENFYSELDNFIHIVSSVDGKVLTPNEIKTQGNINYFKNK